MLKLNAMIHFFLKLPLPLSYKQKAHPSLQNHPKNNFQSCFSNSFLPLLPSKVLQFLRQFLLCSSSSKVLKLLCSLRRCYRCILGDRRRYTSSTPERDESVLRTLCRTQTSVNSAQIKNSSILFRNSVVNILLKSVYNSLIICLKKYISRNELYCILLFCLCLLIAYCLLYIILFIIC